MAVDLTHPFFPFLKDLCVKEPQIEKVLLFGSRARGDAVNVSDFDVAVIAPALSDNAWIRFVVNVREQAPTLCHLDIIRVDQAIREELRRHIFEEGISIYERAKNRSLPDGAGKR